MGGRVFLSFPVSREGKNRREGSETARGRGSQMRDGGAVGSILRRLRGGLDLATRRSMTAGVEGSWTAATGCMTVMAGSMHDGAAA